MGDKKKTYKELNGTTRVGDFLRTINKSGVLGKIVGVAGEIATGDLMGAIGALTATKELSPEEKEHALKLLEMDIEEAKAMLFVALDSSTNFKVDKVWVDLLKTLLVTTYLAYFGSRGVEKYKKISK